MKQRKEHLKQQRENERKKFIHPDGIAVFSFARQSSGDEVDSASISDQLAANRKNAEKLNLKISWEDWDANITGYSYPDTEYFRACYKLDLALQKYFATHAATNNKPVFRDGLGFIFNQMRKGDILLLDTATRLVRATTIPTNESNIWNWLESMEIKTYVSGKLYNPRDIGVKIISAVETQSKEEKARNAVRGLISAKNKGIMIGFHQLFGYVFSKTHGQQLLTPDPDDFPLVQQIFQEFLRGKGKNEICRLLGRRRPGFSCTPQRINMILNNPKYCGFMYNSENELIPCPAVSETAISRPEWNKIQILQQKYKPRKEKFTGRKYLLAGLVKCGYCGSLMKPQANRKGRADKYYICLRHAACIESTPCRGSALIDTNEKQAGFEPLIAPFGLFYFLKNGNCFERMRLENALQERNKELEKISSVLLYIQKSLEENFMFFEMLKQPMENAVQKKRLLVNEIQVLEDDLKKLKEQKITDRVSSLAEWQNLDIVRKQQIMREIFLQIRVFQDHYELELFNRDIISIPKALKGCRYFNPEVFRAEFNRRFTFFRLILKAHGSNGRKRTILYRKNSMEVSYIP